MRDIVPEIFISFFLVGYSVLLVALGWWALRARLVPAVMKGIGLAQTRPMATFHFLGWHLKRESLGSGQSRKDGVNERSSRYSLPRRHSWPGAAFPERNVQRKALKEVA